jgi:hypothetical protein
VEAEKAAPKSKKATEVEAPLKAEGKKLDSKMAENNVTEKQLADSNEPAFQSALDAKSQAQTHAQEAPKKYRQFEQSQLSRAEADAAATAQSRTQAMHGDRAELLQTVAGRQERTKTEDEEARRKVAADIQKIYDRTKTNVEKILSDLDGDVESAFDEGAAAARQAFEDYVEAKMEAYKERRYGGWLGWARWAKDKVAGMPSEVNAFYRQGRRLYLAKMDAVIDNVVSIIGRGLNEAKAEIAKGKKEIREYVSELPDNLKDVGRQAAQDIQQKFSALEQRVEDKQSALIDTLANKYQENLQAVDARIEEMKAANKGLVSKALDKVGGVIKTILELKNMLLGVLSRAAAAVEKIIKDPIGFLGNLVDGVKQGLQNFVGNIGQHLKKGLLGWLTGAMAEAGITLPESFDLKGIFQLVMQILGLTFDKIRARIVKALGFDPFGVYDQIMNLVGIYQEEGLPGLAKRGLARLIGPERMEMLMQALPLFEMALEGDFDALWGMVSDRLSDLKETVFGQIQEFIAEKVIKAGITWVISLLNPAGAFVRACKMIYDIVMFFVERGKQIMALVNAVIGSLSSLASGNLSGAAQAVEDALARSIPVAISFLASLLGLGGVSKRVRNIVKGVQAKVDKALDAVFNSKPVQMVSGFIRKAVGKVKGLAAAGVAKAKGMAKAGVEKVKGLGRAGAERAKGWFKRGKSKSAGEAKQEETVASADAKKKARTRVAKATQQPFKDQKELTAEIKQIESDLIPEGLKSLQVKPKEGQVGRFNIIARQEEDVGDAKVVEGTGTVDVESLEDYRPAWRESTKKELEAIYPEYHVPGSVRLLFEKAMSKEGNLYNRTQFDRRHITAFNDIRSNILAQLQGVTFDEAAITLQNMGHAPKSLDNESILQATKAVLRDKFNDIVNLFVGDAKENQERGRQMAAALTAMDQAAASGDTAAFKQAKQEYLAQGFDPEPIDYFYDKYSHIREQAAAQLKMTEFQGSQR